MMWRRRCARLAAVMILFVGGTQARAGDPRPIRIGLTSSLVQDTPAALLQAAMKPFQSLIENQTGMKGEVVVVPTAELADQLGSGKIDIAVFQGFEYAWAQQQKDFTPLVLAVNQHYRLSARLVTTRDNPANNLAGLRQKSLAVPRGIRHHCLIYLDRECQAGGVPQLRHFARIDRSTSAEDALDDVVDGAVDSALVDTLSWECYERRKPGRFSQLKVVGQSPIFPASLLACRTDTFDEATRRRFADGLQAAHKNAQGRLLLQLWKLTAFEPVPRDYSQILTDIARTYPAPEVTVSSRPAQAGGQ